MCLIVFLRQYAKKTEGNTLYGDGAFLLERSALRTNSILLPRALQLTRYGLEAQKHPREGKYRVEIIATSGTRRWAPQGGHRPERFRNKSSLRRNG